MKNKVVGNVFFMVGVIALIPIALLGIQIVAVLAVVLGDWLKKLSEFLIVVASLWIWLRLPTIDDGLSFFLLLFFSIAGSPFLIFGGLRLRARGAAAPKTISGQQ
jgi:hypothetical protein